MYNVVNMLMLPKNQRGFTIIELLISIGIFAIIVPALAAGLNNLVVLNNRSRDLAIANLIAESKAEEVRNTGFNGLAVGTTDFSSELPDELANPKSASYTISNSTPGLLEVDISISYKDYSSTRTQSYKTIISELGVGQ